MFRLSDAAIKELTELRQACYDEAHHMTVCGLPDNESWYELAAHISAILRHRGMIY